MKTDYNNYDNVKDEKRAIERLKKYMKFKYLQISLYVIFTVIVIFLLISIMRNSGNILSVVGKTVDWFSIITKPIAFGFIIAYLLYPLVNFFEKKLDKLKDKIHHVKPFKNKKKRSSSVEMDKNKVTKYLLTNNTTESEKKMERASSYSNCSIF